MTAQRRWSAAAHRRLFVDHPLLWHVTRRLVWATFDADGAPTASFRLAEDRGYADATDTTCSLPADATVGIAHPLHLGESLPAWGELFADYEILQPFPQLQRETASFTPDERTAATLPRFEHRNVPAGRLLALTQRGWRRGDYIEDIWHQLYREFDCGTAIIHLSSGLIGNAEDRSLEQPITIHLTAGHDRPTTCTPATTGPVFGDLDPITGSELLRDLTMLTA